MNELVMWEIKYVGECFLLGAGLMLIYDILRIFRIVVSHSVIMISVEDMLYWLVAGLGMFLLLYKEDAGSIRWFAVVMTAFGMLIYNFGVSRFAVPIIGKCIQWPLMKISKVIKWVILRIKATGKIVTVVLKKFFKTDRILKRVKLRKEKKQQETQSNGE